MPAEEGRRAERREALLRAVAYAAEQFLRSGDWRECIGAVLERLGTAADVSCVRLFENRPDPNGDIFAVQRHRWTAGGVPAEAANVASPGRPYETSGLGRWREELSRGGLIGGPVAELPAAEQEALRSAGILSILVVPVPVGEAWWGTLGFDDVREARVWTTNERELLRAAASMLGAAIQRHRSEELAKLNQERLALALEGTGQGLWDWDIP
ncbi:MAG TPA: GAF domain-containing protein, partial [Longimicrobiales bacterium]|nr:GAF domain-containing protein [Longimicrobiales bacterium]